MDFEEIKRMNQMTQNLQDNALPFSGHREDNLAALDVAREPQASEPVGFLKESDELFNAVNKQSAEHEAAMETHEEGHTLESDDSMNDVLSELDSEMVRTNQELQKMQKSSEPAALVSSAELNLPTQ